MHYWSPPCCDRGGRIRRRACLLELRLLAEFRLVEPGDRAIGRGIPRSTSGSTISTRTSCARERAPSTAAASRSRTSGDPADHDQPQLRAGLRLQPERRLGRQLPAAVFQPLPHDDRGRRHGDLDVAHAEHRRRAPRRTLPGIHGGPQHRRAIRAQIRDRQFRQQLHRRTADRRAARPRAAAGHRHDGPAGWRVHLRRAVPRLGLFRAGHAAAAAQFARRLPSRHRLQPERRLPLCRHRARHSVASRSTRASKAANRARTRTSTTAAQRSCT